MLNTMVFRSGLCLMALALGACSMLRQPAAPTEAATSPPSYDTTADNPYGSNAPYTPPATTNTPYTPPSTTSGGYVPSYAPVDINAATHTVVRGDTVFNIAKRYQITQDNLRSWNNLGMDNNIQVGQTLRVKPAGYVAPAAMVAAVSTPVASVPPATTTPAVAPVASTPQPATTSNANGTRTVSGLVWQRPTQGKVLQGFGGNSKGIDFGGSIGQSVVAAADGKVVYSGSGLRGYGNLIIVQHNQTFLTAYGNNQSLLAKEGQQVKRGQQIATMGNSDASRTQLHFELRENGQPVDPSRYLPM